MFHEKWFSHVWLKPVKIDVLLWKTAGIILSCAALLNWWEDDDDDGKVSNCQAEEAAITRSFQRSLRDVDVLKS